MSSRRSRCNRLAPRSNTATSRVPYSTCSHKQGGDRYQYDASYYGQMSGLTSQPVVRPVSNGSVPVSGYERETYRDFTTNVGGPVVRDRLWFFGGYQYLRDYDSQPGADPMFPRTYEQDKLFGRLTWRLTPALQLMQSFHGEFWVNPTPPTLGHTVRSDVAPEGVGAEFDDRPPDAHPFIQHGLGRPCRPVLVRPRQMNRALAIERRRTGQIGSPTCPAATCRRWAASKWAASPRKPWSIATRLRGWVWTT